MEPADETNSAKTWYLTEVQPHRQALRAWLLARFPVLPDVDDLVEESCLRLIQAREVNTIRSARALLYTTARNLALDAVRRQCIVRFEPIPEESEILAMENDARAIVSKREEMELLTLAIQSLPSRGRQILTLRTAYGFTSAQIADRLRVSISTVEKDLARSIAACGKFFAARDPR